MNAGSRTPYATMKFGLKLSQAVSKDGRGAGVREIRCRCLVSDWEKDAEALRTDMWASPGGFVRRPTMHCIMRQIGFDTHRDDTLKPEPTLKGTAKATSFAIEISDRMAIKLSSTCGARKVGRAVDA
ncbi:hypothetical protein PSPO01_01457 [Paraphaeosphaeria sporulosa]